MSSSPPPTPPARPVLDDERRFKPIYSPCEWIEDYRPGGYHPVHLGDLFNSGQYKVLRKLGDGSFSTVWLARDALYVALKILVADASGQTDEARILRHLAGGGPDNHITQLLNEFTHSGPNGTHRCLVLEPMGPSASAMVEELPQFNPRRLGMKVRYPPRMARGILKQSLQALVLVHAHGVVHGDLHPGNMLFAVPDLDAVAEEELRQEKEEGRVGTAASTSPPVERVDGKPDRWAPRYLCIARPLTPLMTHHDEGFTVKLSDFGGAFFLSDPPSKPVLPTGLRPPELILAGSVAMDTSLDIWSFGCLVFELVTGQPLFCIPGPDHEDDNHLLALHAEIGALPDRLFDQWTTSSRYFTPDGRLYNCELGGVPEGRTEPLMVPQLSMEDMFDQARVEICEDEGRQVKGLIRRILQYDPTQRPSAAEILRDPWFA